MANNSGKTRPQRVMPMGNPADFPLGSLESRAAARAMLDAMRPQRSQLEEDALLLYHSLKWFLKAPDFHGNCDSRVMAVYSVAQAVHELEDTPWEERPAGLDHEPGYRMAELFLKLIGGDVLTWKKLFAVEVAISTDKDVKARAAWASRCAGLEYPLSKEQSQKDGIEAAEMIWQSVEESAAGIKRDYGKEWKPTIHAVKLDSVNRRLIQIEQVH